VSLDFLLKLSKEWQSENKKETMEMMKLLPQRFVLLFLSLPLSSSPFPPQLIEFMEKAKMGDTLPNDAVIRISRMFKDELTLGNISRPQLVTMCQFMGLVPYGSDSFLRFQVPPLAVVITHLM
jgi:hypothetical protein